MKLDDSIQNLRNCNGIRVDTHKYFSCVKKIKAETSRLVQVRVFCDSLAKNRRKFCTLTF